MIVGLASLAPARPAAAWLPLADGDKGKLEMEVRFMHWGVAAGQDTVPSTAPGQEENVSDFFLRRARILFRGTISPRLTIDAQFGQDNVGSRIAADETGLRIKDLFINYKVHEAFQAVAGQFKVPFLRLNLESGFNQLLVDRGDLAAVRPATQGSRDLGLAAWGNAGGFQYRAALFDGSDQEDLAARSDLRGTVRLSYNWFTRETGFGYSGTRIGATRTLQIGLQGDAQGSRLDPRDEAGFETVARDYSAWAADIFYEQPLGERWALTLEGAWVDRRDDYDDPALETRALDGCFAQAGLLLPWRAGAGRFQVTGRYESYESERGGARAGSINRSVGFNYYGLEHRRKIQVDYTQHRDAAALDDDELRASVVVTF